ncbi:MAG: bifunctional pyr operon transcriptional regulator/uracil phosphoribosyltransferase PyrR [Verrucomicrobia bacterium]|nr:bifunctional pyr operon transcriptional regulator/uracil phosphoribosyltransferase PyrR [Verrucomicrobiota bacterium]
MKPTCVMDTVAMDRALTRMAHEIVERSEDMGKIALVGIQGGGVRLAQRLAAKLQEITGKSVPCGMLDITMHRDDLSLRKKPPVARQTNIQFDVTGKHIIFVDDVLYTGRSTRAAMSEITDFGRPARIQLAVLVDRGHRELPIRADYVGKNIPTSKEQKVRVLAEEVIVE